MRILATLALLLLVHASAISQLTPPFVEEELEASWNYPVQILFENNGRGYVVEKTGKVWILEEGDEKLSEPLVDISEEVWGVGDHGLLSMALHPNFRSNGYFYLLYVVDRHHLISYGTPDYDPAKTITDQATIGRITRYTADQSTDFTSVVEGSRKVIIGKTNDDGFPILMPSHGVGSLQFGADGTLLASCGDAGSYISVDIGSAEDTYFDQALEDGILRPKQNVGSFRSQLVDCMNGRILRIDPETGDGLPSNPYYDANDPSSGASRVWVMGLRQPYRFLIKPNTGSHYPEDGDPGVLFIGDVGGSQWEELNIAERGGLNFGWPIYEGYTANWYFTPYQVLNPDAANPLYGDGCDHQFFTFQELIKQPLRDRSPDFVNPCNETKMIPDSIPHFVHEVPVIAWSNEKWNPPTRTHLPGWRESGELVPLDIGDPGSPVEGTKFDGTTSIPGAFYEGGNFPAEYHGKLFLCDFTGWIRVLGFDENHHLQSIDSFRTDIRWIVDMAVNPKTGHLYHVNMWDKIYKISYGGNVAPSAVLKADKYYGPSPLTVNFDASLSSDHNGDSLSFQWDFGNGMTSTEVAPTVDFNALDGKPETFYVTLMVKDSAGATRTDSAIISVNNTPPTVQITSLEDGALYTMTGNTHAPLEANVTDKEHGADALEYSWEVFLHHNDHFHPDFPINQKTAIAVISPAGCNGEDYWYRIRLTVEDANGLKGLDEVEIFPDCSDPFTTIDPFTAEVHADHVKLNWDLSSAADADHFTIERALQYDLFSEVAETRALTWRDESPLQGVSTYRVVAHDGSGKYVLSDEVDVEYPPPPAISVFPNPANDHINIAISETSERPVQFRLFTPSGALLMNISWDVSKSGEYFQKRVATGGLSAGIYFYKIESGNESLHGSLVVSD